jgi:hypothetical protein
VKIDSIEPILLIICGVFIALTLIAILRLTKRPVGALITLLIFAPLSVGMVVFTQDVYSYRNLAEEQSVARVFISLMDDDGHYDVTLDMPGNETRHFMLMGDQWRLEGRVLRWRLPVAQIGITNLVRLERLSNRFAVPEESNIHIDYSLPNKAFVDTWPILQKARFLLEWVDAEYGNGVFAPLTDGAAYGIYLGRSGMFLRAENPIAIKALQDWSA